MARQTWSRPYLSAVMPDGTTREMDGARLPEGAHSLVLRWRHPGRANARKRTVACSDAAAVAAAFELAARIAAAHADPGSYTADEQGAPCRASRTAAPPDAAPAPVIVLPPVLPQAVATAAGPIIQATDGTGALPAPLGAIAALDPTDRLRAYPGNPVLAAVRAGAVAPGWTMQELIAHWWANKLATGSGRAKNRTDIESNLSYIDSFFRYDLGQDQDTDEVVDWKVARARAVGAGVGSSMHVALLLPHDLFEFMAYRRCYDARTARLNSQAQARYQARLERWERGGRAGRAPAPERIRPMKPVTDRTVESTMKTLGSLMTHAAALCLLITSLDVSYAVWRSRWSPYH